MKNVKVTIDDAKRTCTITIDLTAPTTPSKSGKTRVIASTLGNKEIKGGTGIYLGLNCYTPV